MSIQTLADSLGLSISTVSRALNGYTDVSAKTRLRVQEAARAANYQPDPVAHRLATGRKGAVAVVTTLGAGQFIDATYAAAVAGVTEVMRTRQYFTLSINLPGNTDEMPEFERFLAAKLVDGVILTRTSPQDARVAMLQAKKLPFITHGRTLGNAPHAWVDSDSTGAIEQSTAQLISLGHQRIGFINGQTHMNFALLREMGYRQAMLQANLNPDYYPVQYTDLSSHAGKEATALLLASPEPPSAVVCVTDTLAFGAMEAIKEAGLRVGQDVAVFGYGNVKASSYVVPPLATVNRDAVHSGKLLAQHLLGVIDGDDPETHQIIETPSLVLRASMGTMLA